MMSNCEKEFPERLEKLRIKKGVSARSMSLALGQNAGYISSIEKGRAMPSMAIFFAICEYLEIAPQDFFEYDMREPEKLRKVLTELRYLDTQSLQGISILVSGLPRKNKLNDGCLRSFVV